MEQLLRAQVNDISEEEVLFEIAQVQSLPESPMEGEEVNKVEEVQCRIRVQTTASDEHDEGDLVNLSDVPDITQETKTKWVDGLMQFMHPGDQPQKHIRTIDLILGMDGSVRSTPEAEDTSDSSNTSAQEDTTASSPPKDSINTSSKQETTTSPSPKPSDQQVTYQYPYHYRIPPASISTLSQPDQTHRAEMFALATLFYEIGSGSPPYPNLPESEVQELYGKGEFPVEAEDLNDGFLVILAYWSKEFAGEIEVIAAKAQTTRKLRTIGLSAGAIIASTAALTPLMLGFIGFSALGPIAGSIAAGWQSSLGAYVGAGSLFAWCQSAAMGGAAANTVFATLVAGASAGAAWGAGSTVLLKNLNKKPEELLEIFGRVYRKVES